MSINQQVNNALKIGNLIPEFLEENRLLETKDKFNQKFNNEMQRIYERLLTGVLGSNYPKDEFAVTFMLQVNDEPNAGIWTFAQPPVIQFSTGLLKLADKESEIAAVLAHELGHHYFEKKLGAHNNGKLEELGADLRAPYMLRMANYPQTAMREIIQKLPNDSMDIFATLTDAHPSKQVRISALETAERALSRGNNSMGEQKEKSINDTPNTGALKQIAQQAAFESHIDKILHNKSFHSATTENKISILADVITSEIANADPYFTERTKDVAFQISRLPLARGKDSHEQALIGLVDAIAITPDNEYADKWKNIGSNLYTVLQKNYYRDDKDKANVKIYGKRFEPIGSLKALDDAIKGFVTATDEENINLFAVQMNQLIDKYYFSSRSWLSDLKLSGFEMPTMEQIQQSEAMPISPPWEAHLKIALAKNDDVLKALTRLGVKELDPRLELKVGITDVLAINEPKMLIGNWDNKHQIIIDAQGQINGVERVKSQSEKLAEEQERQTQKRQAEEISALETVDWSLLEADFVQFTKQYNDILIPPAGYNSDSYPFVEQFVSKIGDLLEKDAETYAPFISSYLSFHTDNQINIPINDSFISIISNYNSENQKIDLHHPIVNFVREDKFRLFETLDKAHYLSYTNYYDSPSNTKSSNGSTVPKKSPEERWLVDNGKIFDVLPAKSIVEFRKFLHELEDEIKKYDYKISLNKGFITDLVQFEAYRTLSNNKESLAFDDIALLRDIESFTSTSLTRDPLRNALIESITENSSKIINSTLSPEELVAQFKFLAAEKKPFYPSIFLNTPALRHSFEENIKKSASTLENGKLMAFLEELLFASPIDMQSPDIIIELGKKNSLSNNSSLEYKDGLVNPEFRNWTTLRYASSLVEELGKDDGTDEYKEKFKEIIEKVIKGSSKSNALAIFQHLSKPKVEDIETGNKLELQRELSDYMKDKMEMLGIKQAMSHNFDAAVGESVLQAVTRYDISREATINFLIEPFTLEKAENYINNVERWLSEKDKEKFLSKNISSEAKIEQVKLFHENFWDLPYEGRMLAAKLIMFPPEENLTVNDEEFTKNINFVLDKVLPTNGNRKENAQEGRLIVESYLEANENLEDKRILVAAMLVARKPDALQETSISSGEALNLILDALGPAGRKLSQAIESHPATPKDFKDSFADSKTMAVSPSRHEIMKLIDTYKPETDNDRIVHVGKVLGAGSYGVTVAVTKESGDNTAITFLYPNVREQAETEFDVLGKAANILAQKEERFAPVVEMVLQAESMSHHETDMELAAKQAEVAAKLYNNVSVTVNGKKFNFSAAKFLAHDNDYKEFEIIEGDHFNDLAKNNDTKHIKNMATAQLTLELYNIFSGRPFDHDRHGGQQKIVDHNIGQFDFGAMSVTETSPRQKQLLGHIMAGALKDIHLNKTSFNDAIKQQVDKCANNETERDFLAQVQRGLLALGNFQQHVGGEDALKSIIGAIYVSGDIDKGIIDAMRERVGGIVANKVFNELEKAGKSSAITLQVPKQQFDKSSDKSPLIDPPKDELFENLPVEKETVMQAGAGITFATIGAIGLSAINNHYQNKTLSSAHPVSANDNYAEPSKAQNVNKDYDADNNPNSKITNAVYMQDGRNKSQNSEKEDTQEQIIKGVAIAAVTVGAALTIDALTGRHATKALADMANKINSHISR